MSDQKLCPTCGTEYPLSERFCPRDGTALRSSNPQADLVGTVIGNNFHVIRKLGEGGMGTVYLAEHVKMGRKAALKVMNPGMNKDADAIARFNREATNASKLSHPNICAIYDFGETTDGLIFLAMEFIDGESLSSLIGKNGALSAPRAAAIIHQSADALQVAHDYGIVHRDLKPDNIMIARARDGSDMVKVVDFGIAKASSSDAQKVTKTGLVVGTPEYMSPEQLSGDKLDGRSDIYSLGLVAFNCLTGTLPFPSNSAQEAMIMRLTDPPKALAEMRPDIAWPHELQAVLDRALARQAGERYQSAAEFGRDIARAVENMPATGAAGNAADAPTQVIGAAAAGSAGSAVASASAKTVAAPTVPRTRVASPSDRGAAVGGQDAVSGAPGTSTARRGLPMPAIAAAAVILLGGGGWAAMQMMGRGGAVTGADSTANAATRNAAAPAAPAPGATKPDPAAGNPGGTRPPTGANRGAGDVAAPAPIGRGAATQPLSSPLNPGGGAGRSGGAQAVNVEDKISAWKEWTDTEKNNEAAANRAIRDINETLPSLSGTTRVRAYFFLGQAYMIVQREASACEAWLKGRAESGGKEQSIETAIAAVGCK